MPTHPINDLYKFKTLSKLLPSFERVFHSGSIRLFSDYRDANHFSMKVSI